MFNNSTALKLKHGPSSTQLRADFVFPGAWDEFVGDDFYWSQFSLGRLHRLPFNHQLPIEPTCWHGWSDTPTLHY